MHFLLLQKLVRVLLKNCFRLAIIVPSNCNYILTFPHCIKTTRAKYPYCMFPLVPIGYPYLSLVILAYPGYPWLSLVSFDHNQAEPALRVLCAGPSDSPKIYDLDRSMQSNYTHFFRQQFLIAP